MTLPQRPDGSAEAWGSAHSSTAWSRTAQSRSSLDFNLASLLSNARAGNQQSVGELLQHYRNYLMVLANRQIGGSLQARLGASDVVQETMLKAHCYFAQFQGQTEQELLAWLRKILLTNLVRFVEQHVRSEKRDVRKEVSISRWESKSTSAAARSSAVLRREKTPSGEVQHQEEANLLIHRLSQLPVAYREVLVLRNLQGLSFEEAAGRLGRSTGATRMLWLRAIEKLRFIYHRAET